MYTSAINTKGGKTALIYLLAAIICAGLGAVYELFSHGVFSYHMIYAFLYPLCGGALPFMALSQSKTLPCPKAAVRDIYHSGIAALTVGSFFRGALDIYGTTNRLVYIYYIVGLSFVAISVLIYCTRLGKL